MGLHVRTVEIQQTFVQERSQKIPSTDSLAAEREGRVFGFGQWWTLHLADSVTALRGSSRWGVRTDPSTKTPGIEFLMVVAAIWFGCNNAARDIVGEWIVYRRERTVSLKLPSYVFSKVGTGIVRFGNSPYN
jgi:hypothetical protein